MMIREAMTVFWQTLKDTWEELYSLAIANLLWVASAIPVLLALSLLPQFIVVIPAALISIALFSVATAGVYYVTNIVAHAKTFHFSDFIYGIKLYWWRSLLWMLGNIVFLLLVYVNINFYTSQFQGLWVVLVAGFWFSVGIFWLVTQLYFWPMLLQQENPNILWAWRNAAFLILINPFFTFFIVSSALTLLILSAVLTLPFIFVGMVIQGLLANNAVLTLLVKVGKIPDPRPKPGTR
jgi:hypothetical protein